MTKFYLALHQSRLLLSTLSLFILCVSGCASTPSKFYVLNPIASHNHTNNVAIKYHIGLKKIKLAYYLQQPQIVVRKTNHELILDEFNRWAEPLQENIQQTIRTSLMHLLPSASVTDYPWKASEKMDAILTIDILKFETNNQGRCLLQVNYEIRNKENKIAYTVRNKIFLTHVNPKNYNSIVSGMNQNLDQLSSSILRALKHTLARYRIDR